jgi:hypothetical protein
MSQWNQQAGQAPDPLANYQYQPILAAPGSNVQYLGRVIVEFYDDGSTRPDARKIAYSVAAVDGNNAQLATRIAQALVERLKTDPPLSHS